MNFDPVLLEILNNKVASITEEAGFVIRRIGHSLFVKEVGDFGTALATTEGKFFAYPSAIGVANFIDLDCSTTIKAVSTLEPGDVIITNHPYLSAGLSTHIPDINLVVPYFFEEELVCFGWSFLHISDVGGIVPSSISPSSTEIFQEGVLIPPLKLCIRGEINDTAMKILMANTRTPEANMGDLKAMLAAHTFGERRVGDVIRQHGLKTFVDVQNALIDYAGLKAREVMRAFPDGDYEFWDYLDDDLLTNIPLRIRVKLTLDDGKVNIDFTGTDPQTLSAYNLVTGGQRHAFLTGGLLMLILSMDSSIPRNSGIFKYVTTQLPHGSVVNPVAPASVGIRHLISMRSKDVVHGALLKASPDSLPACAAGIIVPLVFVEPPSAKGQGNVVTLELMVGGQGAGKDLDGCDGRGGTLANLLNNPIEIVEDNTPVIIHEFSLRQDSGGAGKWRGGNGIILTFEVLCDNCMVLGRGMDRFRFQPWGVLGGEPGAPAQNVINIGKPDEKVIGKIDVVHLKRGDTFTMMTPGGGGYGNSFERDVESVLSDVLRGVISNQTAKQSYGVVIDGVTVDLEKTIELRQQSSNTKNAIFRFGSERDCWESHLGDADMAELLAALDGFEPRERHRKRREFFEKIFPEFCRKKVEILKLTPDVGGKRRMDAMQWLVSAAEKATS